MANPVENPTSAAALLFRPCRLDRGECFCSSDASLEVPLHSCRRRQAAAQPRAQMHDSAISKPLRSNRTVGRAGVSRREKRNHLTLEL
jgi:hypothetical protein